MLSAGTVYILITFQKSFLFEYRPNSTTCLLPWESLKLKKIADGFHSTVDWVVN
jgi:hypothetical protein